MNSAKNKSVLVGSGEVIDYLRRLHERLLSEEECKTVSVNRQTTQFTASDPDPIDYGGQPGDR